MAVDQAVLGPVFRSEMVYSYSHPSTGMDKRHLFLRSYRFCRKKSIGERIKGSFFPVKRVIYDRLRSTRKIRKKVWFRFRHGLFCSSRKRRFIRLHNQTKNNKTWTSRFW
ncbi:hypothetical protein NMG60_11036579 [Bertholletia excelsa]